MTHYILGRLGQGLLAILGVTLIVFVAARLSGDPVKLLVPLDSTPEEEAAVRTSLGLDRPLWFQYGVFLRNLARGDLGRSIRYRVPAAQLIRDRLPYTALLAASAASITLLIAVPMGVIAATRRGGMVDGLATIFCALGQSAPSFWVAIMAIWIFSVKLGWLPPVGSQLPKGLILPAVTLGIYPIAAMMRLVRSALIEVLASDYIRTARAKGLASRTVIISHALRNALLPVVTLFAVQCAALLAGSVIIEQVFAWPGVGRVMSDAIFAKDFQVIQAGVLVLSVVTVLLNLFTDLSYMLIDPRVKLS